MQEHALLQSGVAPGIQINSFFGHVLEVENILGLGSRDLRLGRPRRMGSREHNSQQHRGNQCEPAQPVAHLSTTVFVAVVADHTVVHIPGDVWMIEISSDIASMATGALEDHVVRGSAQGVHVAIGTDAACIAVLDTPPRVSKRRPQETCRVMAGCAGSCGIDDSRDGRVGGHVVWHRRA
jgi:hypothetical protein